MMKRSYISHLEGIKLLKPVQRGEIEYALDLGCGRGYDAQYLASLGYIVTAVDKIQEFPGTTIMDIRNFEIEPYKYAIIICNNTLPFLKNKSEIKEMIKKIIFGLKPGGAAYVNVFGHNSSYKGRPGRENMPFMTYEEILSFLEELPVKIMDKTTSEGYLAGYEGGIVYQHTHKFILHKPSME